MVREEFEPSAEGLTYPPLGGDTVLALQTPTTAVRVDDLGDGVRSAILLALLVLGLQPSILLLEEPETHMHPAGLRSLTSFLTRLAGERGFQVIASTHSPDFIHIATKLAGEHRVGLKVLFIERTEDGTLESRTFTPEDLDAPQKLGVDVRLTYAF